MPIFSLTFRLIKGTYYTPLTTIKNNLDFSIFKNLLNNDCINECFLIIEANASEVNTFHNIGIYD